MIGFVEDDEIFIFIIYNVFDKECNHEISNFK